MTDYIRCAQCNTPVAEVQNGCLVIRAKHHGEEHTTVLPLNDLLRRYGGVQEKERKILRALQRGPALAVELAAALYCFPDDIVLALSNLENDGLVKRETVRGMDMFALVGEA
jgi:DNA-binding MarR family transcriptional regulator